MIEHRLTRRAFAGAGLASAGLFMTSGARAFADRMPTAESPMGPFYPIVRPTDSDVDLTWVKGRDARAAGQVIEISGRVLRHQGQSAAGRHARTLAGECRRPLRPSERSGDGAARPELPGLCDAAHRREGRLADHHREARPAMTRRSATGRRTSTSTCAPSKTRNVAQMYFPEDAEGNAKDLLYKALKAEDAATSLAAPQRSRPATNMSGTS